MFKIIQIQIVRVLRLILFSSCRARSRNNNRKTVGQLGEGEAVKYLKQHGYRILKRNWNCKCGEVDIIAQDGDYLVFVEVKTRRDSSFAQERLLDTITWRKLRKLRSLAKIFIKYNYPFRCIPRHRVDVLGIILDSQNLSPIYFKLVKGVGFD